MSDLIVANTELSEVFQLYKTPAEVIMAICRIITPQFYKGLSDADKKAERTAITILTAHIDPGVMLKMCELSVQNYGVARSDNSKVFFDINYILTFFRSAFNWFWCDRVDFSLDAKRIGDRYEPTSRTITELWEDGGIEITVKYIADDDYNEIVNRHSKKGNWGSYHTPAYYRLSERQMRERRLNDYEL